MISSNIDDFMQQISAWPELSRKRLNEVAQASVTELGNNIIDRTPVDVTDPDSHVIKGDWQFSVGTLPSGSIDRQDSAAGEAKEQLNKAASDWDAAAGEVFYIANNEAYAALLEYGGYPHKTSRTTTGGFSSQAPAGMLGVSAEEFPQIVQKNASRVASSLGTLESFVGKIRAWFKR